MWEILLTRMLTDGFIVTAFGTVMVITALAINPRLFLQDYPKAIQARVPPKTPDEKRLSLIIGLPFVGVVLIAPLVSTWVLDQQLGGDLSFWVAFANIFGIVMIFNLFDLLVLDVLWLCTFTPKMAIIPGTEGMAEYKDYGYHFKVHTPATVVMALVSAVAALVMALLL